MIIPPKLQPGDEVRVVAPARSLGIISPDVRSIAQKRLESLGLRVTFSSHVEEQDEFSSSSVKSRVDDLHEAFRDKNVKAVFSVIGGFNSNQLLQYIDYSLIKKNQKIFCGYSDITALGNAIYAKTGLITYSGPSFSLLGMKKGFDDTLKYFQKCVMSDKPFSISPSREWSDDHWYKDQEKREFILNTGPYTINGGETEGTIIGGNLCTLNLLQGTEFMPSLKNTILFIEDDYESVPHTFDRDLQSLIHQPGFAGVRGMVIGRFQKASQMTKELLTKIIKTKRELKGIPIIADVDFGHTSPMITFPIGGNARIAAKGGKIELTILEH